MDTTTSRFVHFSGASKWLFFENGAETCSLNKVNKIVVPANKIFVLSWFAYCFVTVFIILYINTLLKKKHKKLNNPELCPERLLHQQKQKCPTNNKTFHTSSSDWAMMLEHPVTLVWLGPEGRHLPVEGGEREHSRGRGSNFKVDVKTFNNFALQRYSPQMYIFLLDAKKMP